MELLKWYFSVPIRALASVIAWIIAARSRVRSRLTATGRRMLVTWGTILTVIIWVAIFLVADESDRSRLTETVRSLTDSL